MLHLVLILCFQAGNWLRTNVQNFSNRSLRKSGTGSASCCSPLGGGIPRDKSSFNFTFDQSYKSLGFSSFNSYGGGSLESIVSELSIDISTLCETPHDQTAISLFDKLQQEIVQLKSNCDSMTEDFTQVKHNRYLPGLSNLLETSGKFGFSSGTTVDENYFDRQQAKDCFRGISFWLLYLNLELCFAYLHKLVYILSFFPVLFQSFNQLVLNEV